MFRIMSAAACCGALTACASYDLGTLAELRPVGPDRYQWVTYADAIYPINSPQAEASRVSEMGKALSLIDTCKDGWTVTSRDEVIRYKGANSSVYDLYYNIQC